MARHIQLFSTDLDGTLLGNPEATERFRASWNALPEQSRPILCYNTGRRVKDLQRELNKLRLPTPDYIIGDLGTEFFDIKNGAHMVEWESRFNQGWDLQRVCKLLKKFPWVVEQSPEFQHPHKPTWQLPKATDEQLSEIRAAMEREGLQVNLVYSNMRDLDVVPMHAGKGPALATLCEALHINTAETLVAGDTANDAGMFHLPHIKGIVVDNALPELYEAVVHLEVYCTLQVHADGVLEGLKHFGILEALPRFGAPGKARSSSNRPVMIEEKNFAALNSGDVQLLKTGYEKALEALRMNNSPMGFLACALDKNETTGTDENYRAVWARDASVVILNTIFLDDEEIRHAQRQSITTLLDHISPGGQIPSNVRIDSGKADYSGVGGICSVDGGLWLIIALYAYIRATGDMDLLHRYAPQLQRAMDWLSAHDSNNDGLLEIPEAGDWTDLFGRSYNVLYDEVLWYRTNLCYGRLLEYLNDYTRAADYLRWSQHIRGEILSTFWPSTKLPAGTPSVTFADQQYTLGDARYLIAQVSPFSYSWRCDVFGNVLAYLMNVLDPRRARMAFDYMWGVGVNEPYPVSDLYPPVQSGDPDWRPYYVVNFLNLPGQYHNGGIWPFIGGMWVRFIHRLGLRDVACRELLKLAHLCRSGTKYEWEFNEWAHARTGRPMGKRYQAWSAACFLRACHELQLTPNETQPG